VESKDFFGAPDPETKWTAPSVLTVVVEACAEEFKPVYLPVENGYFKVATETASDYIISEADITSDITSWVRELQGGTPTTDKIVALVRGNPGWELVIAGRVIRKLRKGQADGR
jgi:hypothetical protein